MSYNNDVKLLGIPVLMKIIQDAERQIRELTGIDCTVKVYANKVEVQPVEAITMTIQQTVCDVMTMSWAGIIKRDRSRKRVIGRNLYIYFMREHTPLSLKSIAATMGGYDHTTILYALQSVQRMLQVEDPLFCPYYIKMKNILAHVLEAKQSGI